MNFLHIGTKDKETILQRAKPPFLLITDQLLNIQARVFDPTVHSFNPLRDMEYKKAADIAAVLYSFDQSGKDTLTVRNGKRALKKALLTTTKLHKLKLTGHMGDEEAQATVEDLLLSPTLDRVLCGAPNFSFKGSIIAHLDRTKISEQDAFIIANLLIGQFKGQVIVLDGGFYLRPHHTSLIRENRLACSVNFLSELPPVLKSHVLLFEKMGRGCTYEDAETLAKFDCPHLPNTDGYGRYIAELMA